MAAATRGGRGGNQRPSTQPLQTGQGNTAALAVSTRSFGERVEKFQGFIKRLIPHNIQRSGILTPEMVIAQATSAFSRKPELHKCTVASIINAVTLSAQLGLEIETPRGHGYLIPYAGVCTYQPGYRGLITLALRNPKVHVVNAHVVLPGDHFEYRYGSRKFLDHVPADDPEVVIGVNENWSHAYCVVEYANGQPSFLVLNRAQLEAIRNTSRAFREGKRDSPWFTMPEEMLRKSPTKRHLKYEDLTPAIADALHYDDRAEAGLLQDPLTNALPVDELVPDAGREGDDGKTVNVTAEAQKPGTDEPKPGRDVGPFTAADFPADEYAALLGMWKDSGLGNKAHFDAFLGRWAASRQDLHEELKKRKGAR